MITSRFEWFFTKALPGLLLFLLAGIPAAGQQLVKNGDFESGDFSLWTQSGTVNGTVISTNSLYAHSGAYGAQLGPSGSLGFISQSVPTTPGQTYFLSLWLESPTNNSGTNIPNEFQISWNGSVIFDQTNIAAIGWTNLQFAVVPTGTNTVLQFGFRDDPIYLGLDDISLTNAASVPVPAAYTFTTLAGYPGYGSADGLGGAAEFYNPFGVAVDSAGNVYVADGANNTIRKITSSGIVSTIAGFPGTPGSADGSGGNARFSAPRGLAVDRSGNIYVADLGNHTIRKMTATSGTNWVVSTIAGFPGTYGTNDGAGSLARFYRPTGIAVDAATNLYVADYNNYTIRKITPAGTNWLVSTIAGLAGNINTNDGTGGIARFEGPAGIALDGAGNLYVADSLDEAIRKITPSGSNWVVSTFAGSARLSGSTDATGSAARFNYPAAIVWDGANNLYVADANNNAVRKVTTAGVVTTIAGLPAALSGSADGTGGSARFYEPQGIGISSAGTLYVADTDNNEIRKVTSAGVVSTFAGTAAGGSADGAGSTARFNYPYGITVDAGGNLYVTDQNNHTVREITPAGIVNTMAGSLASSGSADGVGGNAQFNEPQGVAVDTNGNVYVADFINFTIRKISPAGVVSTIAGLAGSSGRTDGTNNAARFSYPDGIALDNAGNLYVTDSHNDTIRKLTPVIGTTNWVVSTIAGLAGTSGVTDGPNSLARFNAPVAVTVDKNNNLYVVDQVSFASLIRKVTPVGTNWVVSTIAGAPAILGGSTDGIGTNALFSTCDGIDADNVGNLYVADSNNHTLRKLAPFGATWAVSTIGGVAGVVGNVDGSGNTSRFGIPNGITVDNSGNVYVADGGGTIRKGSITTYASASLAVNTVSGTGALSVTLLPGAAGGQWRFGWEQNWRASGTTASGLVQGNYPVQFKSVPGWLVVQSTTNFTVAVTNGGTTFLTNQYYPTLATADTNSSGTLTIKLANSPGHGVRTSLTL
jgi:sugar lactone lactonase YvrE